MRAMKRSQSPDRRYLAVDLRHVHLVRDPDIVLLDEPYTGLDAATRALLRPAAPGRPARARVEPMMRRAAPWLLLPLALLAAAAGWRWLALRSAESSGVVIGGGDGGGLPHADANQEGFDERALQTAWAYADKQGACGLLVMRHGHLVLEHYARGADVHTLVGGGELDHALLMLAAGVAVERYGMIMSAGGQCDDACLMSAISTASGQDYPLFLSRHVWRPLDAAPARWLAPGVRARASDWLRVAGVLLHDGRFQGTQLVPSGWVARLGPTRPASGAEPFAPGEMSVLRGSGATLLWLAPRFDLAILGVASAPPPGASVDETRLPRMIMRSLRDLPAGGGAGLNELVPGH